MFSSGTNEGKLWAKGEAGAKMIKFGSFYGNVSFWPLVFTEANIMVCSYKPG